MSLLSLPAEILHEVIGLGVPEYYESITLACKKTHEASLFYRKDYIIPRKRFRHFSYDSAPGSGAGDDDASGGVTRMTRMTRTTT